MEQRGVAASTIDRRLSTVCGFYRFAHIDGRIASNPAQYVRCPKVQPSDGHGMDRGELGTFLFAAERFDRAAGTSDRWPRYTEQAAGHRDPSCIGMYGWSTYRLPAIWRNPGRSSANMPLTDSAMWQVDLGSFGWAYWCWACTAAVRRPRPRQWRP